MNTAAAAKLFSDNWLSIVSVVFGSLIAHFLTRNPADVDQLRQRLGRTLNRFAEIPRTRLDPALLAAAQSARSEWCGIVSSLGSALCVGAGFFAFLLLRASFPALPRWVGYVVAGLMAGLLIWPIQLMERRAILRRLEHLHDHGKRA